MPIPLDRSASAAPPVRTTKRSVFGTVFRGIGWLAAAPVGWLGADRIARSASFIGYLVTVLRTPARGDDRFKTEDAGCFDLRPTAHSYGLSLPALEALLARRRRQTAQIAYAAFVLAWVFLLGWLWHALSTPWTATRVASAIEFLPFCVLFFLVAFYNALLNFQIRVGRMANWREYLATSQPFWPR
jgi:hypothetical protein